MTNYELNIKQKTIYLHQQYGGKLSYDISNKDYISFSNLSLIYTPGIGYIAQAIAADCNLLYQYTNKKNTFAIISNGTATLGLGDIGIGAVIPILESKSALLKLNTNINCVPVAINIKDIFKLGAMILALSINYRGIILEDIKAPECFVLCDYLAKRLTIPFFHDDQIGTAIAILISILLLQNNHLDDFQLQKNSKIVICGLGAAGIATANILQNYGFTNIYGFDKYGVFNANTYQGGDIIKNKLLFMKNSNVKDLEKLVLDCKLFIGLSAPNILNPRALKNFAKNYVIFALANPVPEISYDSINDSNCFAYFSGRADSKNKINNLSIFPIIVALIIKHNIFELKNNHYLQIANLMSQYCIGNKMSLPLFSEKILQFVLEEFKI